jgi:glycosyltransferase involved in cell wall biosynthesis
MRVLHVLDETAGWEQRLAVGQLLSKVDGEQGSQIVADISSAAAARTRDWFDDLDVRSTPAWFSLSMLAAPSLRGMLEREGVQTIFAWGVGAALAAAAARGGDANLVVFRFDPTVSATDAKSIRTIVSDGRAAVACASTTVMRRLVESGVPLESCVVIRPGVDFRHINSVKKRGDVRTALGGGESRRLVATGHCVGPRSGHDRIVGTAHFRGYLRGDIRVIVPGKTSEARRLREKSKYLPDPAAVEWIEDGVRHEDVIASSDVLLLTPYVDVSTTAVAWAMAASVPIIATAVYSIAELIAHKTNGRLLKPIDGSPMSIKIARSLEDVATMGKERETARGQAYEVFSVRRFADQCIQLHENLSTDAPANTDITDPAAMM